MSHSLPIVRASLSLAVVLPLLFAAVSARAQCSVDSLSKGVSEACLSPYRYMIEQDDPYWAACAVRASGGGDWDLELYATFDPSPTPNCFSDPVATTDLHDGYVDFIAGDFSTILLRNYYAKAMHASGSSSALIEWDTGTNPTVMILNTPRVLSFTPANIIECRDIHLEAGTYRIQMNALGGLQARMYIVANRNQAEGYPRWVERDSALTWTTAVGSMTADSAGFFGIIVTNENAGTGSVSVLVGTSLVGVDDDTAPAVPRISRVVPNPLRGRGRIAYELPRAARVRIEVIDITGRIVAVASETDAPAGPGRWDWDGKSQTGSPVSAGVYFARLVVDGRPADRAKLLFLP